MKSFLLAACLAAAALCVGSGEASAHGGRVVVRSQGFFRPRVVVQQRHFGGPVVIQQHGFVAPFGGHCVQPGFGGSAFFFGF